MPKEERLAQTHKLLGLAEGFSRITHFNAEECRLLVMFHQKLVGSRGPMDRLRFRDVLHVTFDITDDVMLDLCFKAFDRDNDGLVDESEWTKGFSVLIRGTLEELVEFVYFVYDMNGDRSLTREELYHCLRGCIHSGYGIDADELEECERDIVEITMKKLDVDRDGQITYVDFQNAVVADPLLLQACGPCLPAPRSCAAFLALITMKYRSYTGAWQTNWSLQSNESHGGHKRKSHHARSNRLSHKPGNTVSVSSTTALASLYASKITLLAGKAGGGGGGGGLLVPMAPPPVPSKLENINIVHDTLKAA